MVLLNKEDICSGTFTWLTPYSSAILDYALVSKTLFPEILRMGIDDEVNLLPGRVDLRLGSSDSVDPPSTSPGFYLNSKRDVMRAKGSMDELLNELDWDNLSLDEQCSKL